MRNMKRVLLALVLTLGLSPALFATDYFWVGNSGTWDDTATTHWSLTSGGTGSAGVPDQNSRVTCDVNSGTGTITLSGHNYCLNCDLSDCRMSLAGSGSWNIYGNLDIGALVPSCGFANEAIMRSTAIGKTVKISIPCTSLNLIFSGPAGGWKLLGPISVHTPELNAGTVDTDNYAITASGDFGGGVGILTRKYIFGSSLITVGGGLMFGTSGITVDGAASSMIIGGNTITSTGITFGDVRFTGNPSISGSNRYRNFTVDAGKTYTLATGTTQRVQAQYTAGTAKAGAGSIQVIVPAAFGVSAVTVDAGATTTNVAFKISRGSGIYVTYRDVPNALWAEDPQFVMASTAKETIGNIDLGIADAIIYMEAGTPIYLTPEEVQAIFDAKLN